MKKCQNQINKAEVYFLSKRLPAISEDAMRFVSDPFDFTLSYHKEGKRAAKTHTWWCCNCGNDYTLDELTDYRMNPKAVQDTWNPRKTMGTCPHCGKTMYIYDYACRRRTFTDIVGVHASYGKWAVDRYFLSKCYTAHGKEQSVCVAEIGQVWDNGEGKPVVYFAQKSGSFYSSSWRPNEPFRFLNSVPKEAEIEEWYGVDTYEYPADFDIEKVLAKRGIDANNLHGMPAVDLLQHMDKSPCYETLWKAGEYEMVKFFKSNLNTYWAQIKIARRQGYKIEDLTMWRDMIDALREIRDINSPKWICPPDLRQAHDRAVALKNRWLAKSEFEKERVYDKDLKKRIERFLGMDISDENIQIIVLPSVQAFKEETDHLKHCVYTCGYYKKKESLILSARDKTNMNKRWETIEVDLNNFTILQCYGYGDKFTERHQEITDLMTSNMWQVQQRMRAQA